MTMVVLAARFCRTPCRCHASQWSWTAAEDYFETHAPPRRLECCKCASGLRAPSARVRVRFARDPSRARGLQHVYLTLPPLLTHNSSPARPATPRLHLV